ncbi:MAG: PIG-L family deacetylase [Ilumatobacteraceae bacterium]|nr:PIG-L family deacetylase [Ilumatobacteraceae bacterium]
MAANEPGQPAVSSVDPSTYSANLAVPARALAVGAHPDDIEFGCGGTLAKWAAEGCIIHYAVLTDGSKGTWDVNADTTALVAARQAEQREAARRIGATGSVTFLGAVDGELENTHAMRDALSRLIRIVQPEVVLGHDPWKRYRLHPDHRAAGFLLTDSIVAARDPHFFRHHFDVTDLQTGQPLAHHRPSMLLLWEADTANHVEDVSTTLETKLHALEAHASQFESTMKAKDDAALASFRERMRARLGTLGAPHGFSAAEVFHLMRDL